jgi:hypothetical protein
LAVLAALPEGCAAEQGLSVIVQRLCDRLRREAPPEKFGKLLASAYVLLGLRTTRDRAWSLFRGVQGMHESDTYQAILDEGALAHARRSVLRLGRKKFGAASDDVFTAVQGIEDLERLERLQEAIFDVASWQQLLSVN